ncbi:N-acetylglucosaminyl-diphospho-decaprenol L-rhamnosyltransferase [bacterium HR15]|nr:N-acetylglucosaminyl-diphospho-decaprenol L-rhamnosyltransferase [bacterium HR15]
MPDLSIIVVSYNTRALLRECLASLHCEHISCEVIVVDNASSDGSAEMVQREFPDVRLIANPENRGFGAACNQGLQLAQGRYLLILNADVHAMAGALDRLVEFMEAHPEAVACGGQLRYPDGRIQPSCAGELTLWAVFCEQMGLAKLFPRTRLFGGYWRTWWDFNSTIEVEQVMGACMLLRRLPDGSPPLFDEGYFLYCEDTDLCYRLRQAGGRIFYVHDAVFVHYLGASGEPMRAQMIIYYNWGKERFFRKFHGRWASGVCWLLNRLGALLRWLVGLLLTWLTLGRVARFRRYARTFWQVLTQERLANQSRQRAASKCATNSLNETPPRDNTT